MTIKKDIGFWNLEGIYIPDVQEIGAEEMDKNFNEFFDELNDMANFKNFGEKEETEDEAKKEFIQNFAIELTNTTLDERERIAEKYYEEIAELQQENTELKAENERLKEEIKEVKKYQYEQEFLEKEIEEQREKNKRLTCKILEVKALNETLNVQCTPQDCTQLRKLHQTLQEIKAITEEDCKQCFEIDGFLKPDDCGICQYNKILQKITKAEEE